MGIDLKLTIKVKTKKVLNKDKGETIAPAKQEDK